MTKTAHISVAASDTPRSGYGKILPSLSVAHDHQRRTKALVVLRMSVESEYERH
jgi:hypothetical protein